MIPNRNSSRVRLSSDADEGKPKSILERLSDGLVEIAARQDRIESLLAEIQAGIDAAPSKKEYYTTTEAAELLGKACFTVRQWCRLQRIHAEKTHAGRGIDAEWRISHQEIERIRNEGLLPIPDRY